MAIRRMLGLLLVSLFVLSLSVVRAQETPVKVVATYSILGDIVDNIAGENVELTVLVGRDGDSHVYEPTPQDAIALAQADVIFENGLEFETWIDDLYEASGSTAVRIVVSEGLTPIAFAGHDHGHDDHDHDEEVHGHDHAHDDHDHDHSVDMSEIADLSAWVGEWRSGFAYAEEEAVHEVIHALADAFHEEESVIEAVFEEMLFTAFADVAIMDNAIVYDEDLTCEYTFAGLVDANFEGSTFEWASFETASEGCETYQYVLLTLAHGEGVSRHFHARYGAGDVHDVANSEDLALWYPFIFSVELSVEDFASVMSGDELKAFFEITLGKEAHDHDHDEEGHGHDHDDDDHDHSVDMSEIADLSAWVGEWRSGFAYAEEEAVHEVIHALADALHEEESVIEAVFEEMLFTAFADVAITDNAIIYDEDLTCEYVFAGLIDANFEGSTFEWASFETASEGCETYQYVLLTLAHGEGVSRHFHARYGAGDIHDVANSEDLALWYPFLFSAELSVEDFASVMSGDELKAFFEIALGKEAHDHDHAHDEEGHDHAHDDYDHAHNHGEFDPHIWHDPHNGIIMAENIRDALSEIDPANDEVYQANAEAYIAELTALDVYITEQVATIPAENRLLVTSHESFGYFASRYGFEVMTALGTLSTDVADPSAGQIASLIEEIKAFGVPAVFGENITSAGLLEQLSRETGVNFIETLYTDALGQIGTDGDSYLNLLRFNADTIVEALR